MTTIQPEGAALRNAVRWISEQTRDHPDRPLPALMDQAILRFDLSPADAEFLMRFYEGAVTGDE